MLSVEAVKIKSSNILKSGQKVKVYVLTFNNHLLDHSRLNAELQNNWFSAENHDLDDSQLEICHFTDFLDDMSQGFKKKTRTLLANYAKSGLKSPEDFKQSMIIIAEKLNGNNNNKTIVMIDELRIDCTFKKSKSKEKKKQGGGGRRSSLTGKNMFDVSSRSLLAAINDCGNVTYKVDFSYLSEYENVHFIISLQPQAGFGADFEIIFPTDQISQYYQILKNRHRHTLQILEFLKFYHENNSGNRAGLLKIDLEDDFDVEEAALPPVLEDLDHYGVIWLPLKTDYFHALESVIESEASEVNTIIQKLIGKPFTIIQKLMGIGKPSSIVILCDSKNAGNLALIEGMKKVNPDYGGPFEVGEFNGIEADIILYLCHYNEQFSIASMARARRLLILVTWDRDYDELMENAVNENLVQKLSLTEKYPDTVLEETEPEEDEEILAELEENDQNLSSMAAEKNLETCMEMLRIPGPAVYNEKNLELKED